MLDTSAVLEALPSLGHTGADCLHPPIQPKTTGMGERLMEGKKIEIELDQHTGITEKESRRHLAVPCLGSPLQQSQAVPGAAHNSPERSNSKRSD